MYNDTKTIYNKELIIGVRNSGKKVKIELTINQETEGRKAETITHEIISGYKTLSICGDKGQNIEEVSNINNYKNLFISKSDIQTIINIWKTYHLNDMKPNCIHQMLLNCNSDNYSQLAEIETKKCPNEYKYGSKWLVEIIPENILNTIITIFEKYNKIENIEQETNRATFKQFEVKATFKGDKKATWSENNFNNHMVKVINTETKQSITFEFWASIASPELKTEYDVLNAFYCFVEDAISGTYEFNEFCSEFGYDEDSRKARSTWRACQRSLTKLKKLYDGNMFDLANELQEVAQ